MPLESKHLHDGWRWPKPNVPGKPKLCQLRRVEDLSRRVSKSRPHRCCQLPHQMRLATICAKLGATERSTIFATERADSRNWLIGLPNSLAMIGQSARDDFRWPAHGVPRFSFAEGLSLSGTVGRICPTAEIENKERRETQSHTNNVLTTPHNLGLPAKVPAQRIRLWVNPPEDLTPEDAHSGS